MKKISKKQISVLDAINQELRNGTRIGQCTYEIPPSVARVMRTVSAPPMYSGLRLACTHKTTIKSSPAFLERIQVQNVPRAIVNEKAAWLYICGRDILKQGIILCDEVTDGTLVLVMNEETRCLGYGTVVANKSGVQRIMNVYDVGDYLRRE